MISAMVKQSWTSQKSMSVGPHARHLVGRLRPPWRVASSQAMSRRGVQRDGVGGVPDAGDLHERLLASFLAMSSGQRTTAAAPSVMGEQSRMCSGSATITEFEHRVHRDLHRELGERVQRAVVVVLDRDLASCSRGRPVAVHVGPAIIA